MILAAAGAIDHDELVKLGRGPVRRSAPQPCRPAEPARFHCGERREVKRLEQAHFALAIEAPAFRHRDVYTAQVFAGPGRRHVLAAVPEAARGAGLCYTTFAQAGAMRTPARSRSMPAPARPGARSGRNDHRRDPPRRRGRDRAGSGARPRADEGRAADGARKPLGARRAAGADAGDLGPGADLEETVEKIDAVDLAAIRAYGERTATERGWRWRSTVRSSARRTWRRCAKGSCGLMRSGRSPAAARHRHRKAAVATARACRLSPLVRICARKAPTS
jgi:hypothetical protein